MTKYKEDPERERQIAVTIVAYGVVERACRPEEDGIPVEWGNYPEIGEDDWEAVVANVARLSHWGLGETYERAYAVLEARANKSKGSE